MNKETENKLKTFLHNIFGCALMDELNHPQSICEVTSTNEIIEFSKELGFNDLAEDFQEEKEKYI